MLSKGNVRNHPSVARNLNARDIYELLLESPASPGGRYESRQFLKEQLERASRIPHDFPAEPQALEHWMERKALNVGARYAEYLDGRKQGKPRQYFSNKAHALSFLQQVAPTKLVDGAWLYGILRHWEDVRLHGLVRTYLEELGDGDPDQNHVVLYQRLLAETGCETLPELSEEHYVRGAIQLALGYNADQFLPELVGYNLGYEQLPLHLLITAFELAELDIDPYYFTLHITIDNASTGHARKAVQAVKACVPVASDTTEFWQRVIRGYQLNDLGLGANDIISGFDLEHELILMLERKRVFGQHLHSDFCSIGGRTVNEWLSAPGQIPSFLETLEAKHWIVRNQDPQQSRFWRLIDGPTARMAGVFDGYEKQLLHDWIAGDQLAQKPSRKRRTFRRYRGRTATERMGGPGDIHQDVSSVQRELLSLADAQRMQRLINLMSPSKHATAAGLFATREFVAALSGKQP